MSSEFTLINVNNFTLRCSSYVDKPCDKDISRGPKVKPMLSATCALYPSNPLAHKVAELFALFDRSSLSRGEDFKCSAQVNSS